MAACLDPYLIWLLSAGRCDLSEPQDFLYELMTSHSCPTRHFSGYRTEYVGHMLPGRNPQRYREEVGIFLVDEGSEQELGFDERDELAVGRKLVPAPPLLHVASKLLVQDSRPMKKLEVDDGRTGPAPPHCAQTATTTTMHPVLKAQLKRDFPRLFRYSDLECSIGNGWEPLLRRLCNAIHHNPDIAFSQIKEKFAGLRAYNGGTTSDSREKQHMAEAESFLICEHCGEDGRMVTSRGWVFTSCQECLDVHRADGRRYRERDVAEEEEEEHEGPAT
ncbi:hypothetical protein C8F01DRAFT_1092775 [Mycena amicta]|nr:hypothetical protein C8F01DRAFT_1092775 [Mycena amicta]